MTTIDKSSLLTPVINLATENLVLLQLESEAVINRGGVVYDKELDLMTVSPKAYEYITKRSNGFIVRPSQAMQFFADHCAKQASLGKCPSFSVIGYELAYASLFGNGMTMLELVKYAPAILASWSEKTPAEILDAANINHDGIEGEDLYTLALDELNNNPRLTYYTRINGYDNHLKTKTTKILYSEVMAK